jgi:hypothetical protein
MDRRAIFFILAAATCALLVPLTPSSLRYVGVGLSGFYIVLALLSFLDDRSRRAS